jgi:lipopolysaccharide export LptBFGC system permease protein LptF
MLRGLIFWKLTYVGYSVAFLLSFLLIAVQLFRLGNVVFGLPPTMSVPFIFLWFSNYSLFFIPDGAFVASASLALWLKERKLLQVIYSFGISPLRVLGYLLLPALAFTILQLLFSHTLHEEKVAFARKNLLLKYKERVINNLSEKTFFRTQSLVIYAEKREAGGFKNLFFKHKDLTVLAHKALSPEKGLLG